MLRVRIIWRAPVPGVCLFGVREILHRFMQARTSEAWRMHYAPRHA